jgi:hypothetical protein
MSLRSKLKADATLANEGVWVHLKDYPNPDKTVPAFKLTRQSVQNKLWSAKMAELMRPYIDDEGNEKITPDQRENVTRQAFAETLLLDWENVELDEDNVKTEFDPMRIAFDMDWDELYGRLHMMTLKVNYFQTPKGEAEIKN